VTDVDTALGAARTAIDAFVVSAERCASVWTVPRAPGKWSPSQVTEHVARALEESAKVARGEVSQFPTLWRPLRWLLRMVFFNRVLGGVRFPNGKTAKALDPVRGPATVAEGRSRLEAALVVFDHACRMRAANGGIVDSPIVGAVPIPEFARFQALHVRHHEGQMCVPDVSSREP
jgi:hypothetical protein